MHYVEENFDGFACAVVSGLCRDVHKSNAVATISQSEQPLPG
jgi:hypothetical protein